MIYTNALMSAVILVGWLILVGAGILRRGEPMGKLALQAGMWLGIIGVLWLAASLATSLRHS
jgi:predicted aspartyl protease